MTSPASPLVTATIGAIPYTVSLSDTTHQWVGDADKASGGADAGPSPHSQLLAALGSCTAITLSMYAGRKTWALEGVEVVLGYVSEAPGKTTITRAIKVHGKLDAEQKERLLQIANACPIHKVLSGEISIESSLTA